VAQAQTIRPRASLALPFGGPSSKPIAGQWAGACICVGEMEKAMLKVRDIMSPDPVTFDPDTPIEAATNDLIDNHFGGAPVVDRGRVVGVLSKTDLLDRDRPGERVGEVMTPLVFYLRVDEPAMSAVRLMRAEGIHRVIVIEGRGMLAGIVTTTDVLGAIERGESFHEGDEPREPS
jgi:predicted transcriptional regulator